MKAAYINSDWLKDNYMDWYINETAKNYTQKFNDIDSSSFFDDCL